MEYSIHSPQDPVPPVGWQTQRQIQPCMFRWKPMQGRGGQQGGAPPTRRYHVEVVILELGPEPGTDDYLSYFDICIGLENMSG